MYFRLTGALKSRFIYELRRFWSSHPKYKDLVDHIEGKYSFRERPSLGIIVKTGAASRVDLAPDNYIGVVNSYTYLTKIPGRPGVAVEWVREDSVAIQANEGRFPSVPGVYYIELTADDEFYVDPLYAVRGEPVVMADTTTGQLQQAPLDGSLRLFEMPNGYMLQEGTDYTLPHDSRDQPTGEIRLVRPVTGGRALAADYHYPGTSSGPYKYAPARADNVAIPGVMIAFGRRAVKGDACAVVVQAMRHPAVLEYGGRWELTLDFDVLARDVYAQQEIADETVMYLWGVLRPYLSSEGIEMTDCTLGGESEEIYDETGDDYFYNSSFSITVQTEWLVHVPLMSWIRTMIPLTLEQARAMAQLSDEEMVRQESSIRMIEGLGLEAVRDPYFAGRLSTYETIG